MQVGGGLRDLAAVEQVLGAGAQWAVVGTRAALDPAFLGEVCGAFEGQIIVAVDASDGKVAVDGWKRVLDLDATALARDAAAAGAAAVLYTDIARDGTQGGPNVWSTEAVARAAGIPLLASGGWARSTTSGSSPPSPAWRAPSSGARSTAARWTSGEPSPRWADC